ncbi:hypothetical protein ALC56_14737, partial [Trachymyrmex septentrionalis]
VTRWRWTGYGGGEGCVESRRIGRRVDRHTRESIRCASAILLPVRRAAAEAWIPDGVDSAARTNRSLSRAALSRSIGTPEGGRESYRDPPRGPGVGRGTAGPWWERARNGGGERERNRVDSGDPAVGSG